MAKSKSKGKHRLDKYYHLAKEQGYRSRAAYKLVQLNRRFPFLEKCNAVLDLCAAPGGWLQVCRKTMPMASLIVGVDLVAIKAIRGVRTLMEDITTPACRAAIKREARGALFDAVLHDGAPNVGGNWSSEAYMQNALALEALRLATDTLAPKGTFVTKVFRSKDYNALLFALNALFDRVDSTKPVASRNTSAEIFVVCQGYKAPAKIDPKLLDARHLFAEAPEPPKVVDVLRPPVQKKHREGYADGVTVLDAPGTVAAFMAAERPAELLGTVHSLAFPTATRKAAKPTRTMVASASAATAEVAPAPLDEWAVESHHTTTDDIRALCADLRVLGKREFKTLLKWRLDVRKTALQANKALAAAQAPTVVPPSTDDAPTGLVHGTPEDEASIMAEMEELRAGMAARKRKAAKRARKLKARGKARAVAGQGVRAKGAPAGGENPYDVGGDPEGLFTLDAIPGAKQLAAVADAPAEGDDQDDSDIDDDDGDAEEEALSDDDDARAAYDASMTDCMDRLYHAFTLRKGTAGDKGRHKRRRARLGDDGGDGDDALRAAATRRWGPQGDDDDVDRDGNGEDGYKSDRSAELEWEAGDGGAPVEAANPLAVDLDGRRWAASSQALAARWFSQPLFAGVSEEDPADEGGRLRGRKAVKRARVVAAGDDDDDHLLADDSDTPIIKRHAARPTVAAAAVAAPAAKAAVGSRSVRRHPVEDFEVVRRDDDSDGEGGGAGDGDGGSDGGDSEADSLDALTDHDKAEILAIGKRFLSKRAREEALDDAYNRYTFADEGAPGWLLDDERVHLRAIAPVTKAEVLAARAQFRSINSRAIHKVAEARGRKRQRVAKKLEQARARANVIADQEDLSAQAKGREIGKLYARAKRAGKEKGHGKEAPKATVAKKFMKGKVGGKTVDPSMKKAKRAAKSREKRSKKSGKAKGRKG